MGDLVFNIAKGRVKEYFARVDGNDPANSALIICLFTGAGTDATAIDLDTLAAIEADAGFTEVTDASYARKVLTDANITLAVPVDASDVNRCDIDDQTWSALAGGDSITRLVIAYDNDTTGGTDANIVPLTMHDFVVTSDGTDVTATIHADGFFEAG